MSKCYVIKNKDGKYMSESCEFETNQLWQAQLFDRKEIAEFYCNLKENEVIECTICEGDLELELKELRKLLVKELEYHEVYKSACEKLSHDLAAYEWQGEGRFARSEEIICAEAVKDAREEIEKENNDDTN